MDGNVLNCTTSFDLRVECDGRAYVGGIASLIAIGIIRNSLDRKSVGRERV